MYQNLKSLQQYERLYTLLPEQSLHVPDIPLMSKSQFLEAIQPPTPSTAQLIAAASQNPANTEKKYSGEFSEGIFCENFLSTNTNPIPTPYSFHAARRMTIDTRVRSLFMSGKKKNFSSTPNFFINSIEIFFEFFFFQLKLFIILDLFKFSRHNFLKN
jgi:hypothetical protein